jgi:small subunit ribosomal protein S21
MQHCTVLHITLRADTNGVNIAPDNRVHPHTRLLAQNDIANYLSGQIDVAAYWNDGGYSLIGAKHETDFTLDRKFTSPFLNLLCLVTLRLPTFYVIPASNQSILKISRLGLFGGVFFLAEVRVQEGEPLENALRRFKRKVQTEDIIKEVKRHSFYLKPGEKKRVKEALARKRNRKKVRKEQD